MKNSLYVSDRKEISRVLVWTGVIIFWLTFWLPSGIFLAKNQANLGAFFPELELVLPVSIIGIVLVLLAKFLTKSLDKNYFARFWYGTKTIGLWLLILLIIAIFSRDFQFSVLFLLIFIMGFFTIPINKELFPENLYKNSLLVLGTLTGFLIAKISPELHISQDLLALVATLGMAFLSDQKVSWRGLKNPKSREFLAKTAMQIAYLFIIFQSDNLIFQLLTLFILFFSGKIFINRRGHLHPDVVGVIFFAGFFIWRIWNYGIYKINLPTVIPHFWSNFREIFVGVGQGQFLPALQEQSSFLLPLSSFQTPNSGLLLTLFEQGVLGVLAMFLLFFFSYLLHQKRSKWYLFIILTLWFFSREFMASENGLILLILFLFLDVDWKISRDFQK